MSSQSRLPVRGSVEQTLVCAAIAQARRDNADRRAEEAVCGVVMVAQDQGAGDVGGEQQRHENGDHAPEPGSFGLVSIGDPQVCEEVDGQVAQTGECDFRMARREGL